LPVQWDGKDEGFCVLRGSFEMNRTFFTTFEPPTLMCCTKSLVSHLAKAASQESISKLFSTQRRRIYALEQRTAEAQMNNEAGEKKAARQSWLERWSRSEKWM